MDEYKRSNNNYQSNSTYTSNNTTYQISGYSSEYNTAKGICRGTCKTHNLCSCGANRQ
ncbi:MAG: hypothetical protein ACP5NV_05600 [Candidatus Woesearchaeota archaeon]